MPPFKNGKPRAWTQGVDLRGAIAMCHTIKPSAKPRPRPKVVSDEGEAEDEEASCDEEEAEVLLGPELEEAMVERARRLVDLIQSSNVQPPSGLPRAGKVISSDNALLFVARLCRMVRQRGLEVAAPRVAFHWTAEENFQSIVDSNLRVPDGATVVKKHGAAFGRGIYTSPDFRYAKEDFSYGSSATFMCLVLTGVQHQRIAHKGNGLLGGVPKGYDSIKGRLPNRPSDTWVFCSSDQVLPCFLLDELALKEASAVLRDAIALLCEPWPHMSCPEKSVLHQDPESVFTNSAKTVLQQDVEVVFAKSASSNGVDGSNGCQRHSALANKNESDAGSSPNGYPLPHGSKDETDACSSANGVTSANGYPVRHGSKDETDAGSSANGCPVEKGGSRWSRHRAGTLIAPDLPGGTPVNEQRGQATGSLKNQPGTLIQADSTQGCNAFAACDLPRRRWNAGGNPTRDDSETQSVASTTDAATPNDAFGSASKRGVVVIFGDLLTAEETLIVHQCNCVVSGRAEGVAAAIFECFPNANVYQERKVRGRSLDRPGTISVHGRVVNLYGQFCPGKPMDSPVSRAQIQSSTYANCFEQFQGIGDSREERLMWFKEALKRLPGALPNGAPRSLALPCRIGCGLAGGNWPMFLKAIREFAADYPDLYIAIYDNATKAPARAVALDAARLSSKALTSASPVSSVPMQPNADIAKAASKRNDDSFWASTYFEFFCNHDGKWKRYSMETQIALRNAVASRCTGPLRLEVLGPNGTGKRLACVFVKLSGVELGRGEEVCTETGDVAYVRLCPPSCRSGQITLPDELDDVAEERLEPQFCGKLLDRHDVKEAGAGAHDECAICCSSLSEDDGGDEQTCCQLECTHIFHQSCISQWFKERPECPTCKRHFGKIIGSQPRVGSMTYKVLPPGENLPGHDSCGIIVMQFRFPPGKDDQGIDFAERKERGFLPDDAQGRVVLALMRLAFRRRVLFGLGESMTLGIRRATFNVHLKTSRTGGSARHGYPDSEYFGRVLAELRSNGVILEHLK